MAAEWFYKTAEKNEHGPITAADLKKLAASGHITRTTLIRKQDGKWIPASQFKGLLVVDTVPPKKSVDFGISESSRTKQPQQFSPASPRQPRLPAKLVGGAIIGVLLVVGMIAVGGVTFLNRNGKQSTVISPNPADQSVTSEQAATAKDVTPDAVLKAYISVTRWEDRLAYVLNPEQIRPHLAKAYGNIPLGPDKFLPGNVRSADSGDVPVGGKCLVTVDVSVSHPDEQHFSYVIVRTPDGFKIDWMESIAFDKKEKTSRIQKTASQGDAKSQLELGLLYASGEGLTKDDHEAFRWISRSANQKYAEAEFRLGQFFEEGRGVDKDDSESLRWYRKAAENNCLRAQLKMAICYYSGELVSADAAEAARWLRKASDLGSADAQRLLGGMYIHGLGVAQDAGEAAFWYRKAAEQGDADAQRNMGVFYEEGKGVAKDRAKAIIWYRKAAEQGHAVAQVNLGLMYVGDDKEEARRLFQKAADQGGEGSDLAKTMLKLYFSDPSEGPVKSVETVEEREAASAKLTPEQWIDRRKKQTAEQWKNTYPDVVATVRDAGEFLIYGDVSAERLEQIGNWASKHADSLKVSFNAKETPLWRGKLAVFVFRDRLGYEEFNQAIHRRLIATEIIGHSEVSGKLEEALIAMHDVGDEATESSPGMHASVIEHVTGAFLKRGGAGLPDWVIRGTGLALAFQDSKRNPYFVKMLGQAGDILRDALMSEPEDVFENGTFSPGEVGPIGFTLVLFMFANGGSKNFGEFVRRIQSGSNTEAALKAIYNSDARTVALAYAKTLPAGGVKTGKDDDAKRKEIRKKVNEMIEASSQLIPENATPTLVRLSKNLATRDSDIEVKRFLNAYVKAIGICAKQPAENKGLVTPDLFSANEEDQLLIITRYGIAEHVLAWSVFDPDFKYFVEPVVRNDPAAKGITRHYFELTIKVLEDSNAGKIFVGTPYAADVNSTLKKVKNRYKMLSSGPLK